MKKLSFLVVLTFSAFGLFAQSTKTSEGIVFPQVDSSPLDVVYYPLNTTKSKENTDPVIRVFYSRPFKKGREIFGVLEPFDKVWRLGANESTEIDFFKPVFINNTKIKSGRYSLFAILGKEKWTLIVNKQTDKWGAFSYDQTKDVVRIEVPVEKPSKVIEMLSMTFNEGENTANLIIGWDNTQVSLPIKFKK